MLIKHFIPKSTLTRVIINSSPFPSAPCDSSSFSSSGPVLKKRLNATHNRMGKPQFLKVLFKDFMEKMPIPTKFMQRHLAAEPGLRRATFLSQLGKFWHVDVARDGDGDDVYLAGGWAEFVRANKLEEDNFLVFRYEGNMVFTVKVFETSGCVKDYGAGDIVADAAGAAASLEKTAPKQYRPDATAGLGSQPTSNKGHGKHKTRKISERKPTGDDDDIQPKKHYRSHRIWIEENADDDDDQDATPPTTCTQTDDANSDSTATQAKDLGYTGARPVYVKTATPCNLRYGFMNIGKKFCMSNGLTSNGLMIVKDTGGRSWPVKLTLTSDQARMKAGWCHFSSHHGIKVGDLCVFDVSIRRAA